MRVLVTGGAGYLGSVLCHLLLESGHEVRVLDRLTYGGEALLGCYGHRAFEFAPGDICDDRVVADAVTGCEAVLHLAAFVGEQQCQRNPEETVALNDHATRRLFEAAARAGVGRFVFASTCSSYGYIDSGEPVDESAALCPTSLYAETKVAAERYLLVDGNSDMATTILRFATLAGLSPRMRFDLILNDLVKDAYTERRIEVYGPNGWRPLVHVRDAAQAPVACLAAERDVVRGQVFNVGVNSENYRKQELAVLVAGAFPGTQVEIRSQDSDARSYRVNFDKIGRTLGWQPCFTMADAVQEIKDALDKGVVRNPTDPRYAN